MIHESILDTIGRTPVVRLNRIAPEGVAIYAKVESFNPGGSVKDRLA
ncbi:MAG: pyridoxal-phosphate dependent enzyme, partial [Gammaproteobacteria bacterium]|nr:pyridoxal-phosphate dependent enzyme [Gammaproteobacteria bacterium]